MWISEAQFPHACAACMVRNKFQTHLHDILIPTHNYRDAVPRQRFETQFPQRVSLRADEISEAHCGRACANWNLRIALPHVCAAHSRHHITPTHLCNLNISKSESTRACTSWNLRTIIVSGLKDRTIKTRIRMFQCEVKSSKPNSSPCNVWQWSFMSVLLIV